MIWYSYVVGVGGHVIWGDLFLKNDDDIDDVSDMNAPCHSYVEPISFWQLFFAMYSVFRLWYTSGLALVVTYIASLATLRPLQDTTGHCSTVSCLQWFTEGFFFSTDALCKLMPIILGDSQNYFCKVNNRKIKNSFSQCVHLASQCRYCFATMLGWLCLNS